MPTLVQKTTGQTNACFREFLALHAEVSRDATNLNAVSAFVEAQKQATSGARQKFVVASSLETFQAWVAAKRNFNAADNCV